MLAVSIQMYNLYMTCISCSKCRQKTISILLRQGHVRYIYPLTSHIIEKQQKKLFMNYIHSRELMNSGSFCFSAQAMNTTIMITFKCLIVTTIIAVIVIVIVIVVVIIINLFFFSLSFFSSFFLRIKYCCWQGFKINRSHC